MATTLETISEALQQIDSKKENLKKAFEELQTHSSLISSFSLTWSDLDSHFTSIQTSLTQKFETLKTLNSQSTSSSSVPTPKVTEEPASLSKPENQNRVDPVSNGVSELVQPRPELVAFCEKMDGLGLRKYVIETSKERNEIRVELPEAIRRAPDPAAMVVGAMEGFYRLNEKYYKGDKDFELSSVRRSCVLLLEQLMAVCPNVGGESKEKAKSLALEWKEKMTMDDENPLESLGFLHLVAAYGLVSEFDMDELLDKFVIIARYRQAVDLCRKISLGEKVEGKTCSVETFIITKLIFFF